MRQVAHRLELAEVQHALLELLVEPRDGPAADRHHSRPFVVREQELEHMTADQAGGAGDKRGAAQLA